MRSKCVVVAALAGAAMGSAALAGTPVPTVIYSEIATSPTSQVPGLAPGTLFDSFDRLYRSPDGTKWIMSASSDLATSQDEVLLVGDVASASATVTAQEGVTVIDGETVGFINRRASINNAGEYVFATNTDGPTTGDEKIVKWDGSQFIYEVEEGKEIPAFGPAEMFGSSLELGDISSNGEVSFIADFTVGSLPSDQDDFVFVNNSIGAQEGVTIPGGQAGGASETWDNFDFEDLRTSADGLQWLLQGDLSGDTASDDVLAINNNVVIQEGSTIAGGGASPVDLISESYMDSAGNWMARGDFETDQDWMVMNGSLIALTGDTVPGGIAGETYSDAEFSGTFFSMVSNNNGDFVIGATTSNPDLDADAVLVFNNSDVIARQGDPVDVDGNGLFDDDAFIDVFNNDDAFLTDDLKYFFTATLVDGAGAGLGQALIQYQIPTPGALGVLALGGLAGLRRRRA